MDGLFMKTGIHAVPPSISLSGPLDVRSVPTKVSAVGRPSPEKSAVAPPPQKTTSSSSSKFSFRYRLRSLWPGAGGGSNRHGGLALDDAVLVDNTEDQTAVDGGAEESGIATGTATSEEEQNVSWVLKILHVRSLWKGEEQGDKLEVTEEDESVKVNQELSADNDDEECDACKIDDDEQEKEVFDRDSFSKLLKKVSLTDAKLYAKLSYLGNLAYSIPSIKPGNLLKTQGLRYVTSSIEKKELIAKAEKDQEASTEVHDTNGTEEVVADDKEQKNSRIQISASAAYHIAASAASYLHSHAKNVIPFKSSKPEGTLSEPGYGTEDSCDIAIMDSDMASLMATTDSVTAVVAAKEEVKQAVADDLNSTTSSPCEWFICDDDQSATRFFVIQGSESLASWQANLLFEPIQFEGLDVLVHRGIYEAAKGIYEQMLPEVRSHLKSCGNRAGFRFTGHSLGGSLALLVNLMLLIREEVPPSSLLPVITFGSPSIMCGGDELLRKLGLPRSHVQAIVMHRDIVPRAFSCNYPNHVAELLKAVNKNFRSHPCLNNQKILYAPMGELLILQPDEKFSPQHDLLPSGCGLYLLSCPLSENNNADNLRSAKLMFLNSPHPLEILSDRSAYGSGGTIQRDHDMGSYVKSVRGVIGQELNHIRKARREHRREEWWRLVTPQSESVGLVVGKPAVSLNFGQKQFKFSGMLQSGRESVKRFSQVVSSQDMRLFVVLLFPVRMLLFGAYSVINFR